MKDVKEHNTRLFNSYEFMFAIENGKFPDFHFYVSELSWVETVHALFKKLVLELMYQRNIPHNQYYSCIKDIKIPKKYLDSLISATFRHYMNFPKGCITIKYPPVNDLTNLLTKASIYIMFARCRTQDAFLLSEAKNLGCSHFITAEKRLPKEIMKKEGIEIYNPKKFYLEFRKK